MADPKKNPLIGAFKDDAPKPDDKDKDSKVAPVAEPPKPDASAKPKEEAKKPEEKKPAPSKDTAKPAAPEKTKEDAKPDKPDETKKADEQKKPTDEKKPDAPDKEPEPDEFSETIVTEENLGEMTTIPIDLIDDFDGHPFAVRDDEDMRQLINSVKQVGILEPVVLIRSEKKPGRYEMIAGHRRKHAAKQVGLTKILAVVRNMDHDSATIYMVDSNLKRDHISPMEKAKAYQMRTDAMKRKMGRRTNEEKAAIAASGQKPLTADEELAKQTGESVATVQRIKTLNKLTPELHEDVDSGKLPVNTAADIAQMKPEEQKEVAKVIKETGIVPTGAEAKQLKEASKSGTLTTEKIEQTVAPTKPEKDPPLKVTLTEDELRPYFPDKRTTLPDAKRGIFEALDLRKRAQERRAQKEAEEKAAAKNAKKSEPSR